MCLILSGTHDELEREPETKKCCDPFDGHTKEITKTLRILKADDLPGPYRHHAEQPMCYQCRTRMKKVNGGTVPYVIFNDLILIFQETQLWSLVFPEQHYLNGYVVLKMY